jgi:hypothetical protein
MHGFEKLRSLMLGVDITRAFDGESPDFMINTAMLALIAGLHHKLSPNHANEQRSVDNVLAEFCDCVRASLANLEAHCAETHENAGDPANVV